MDFKDFPNEFSLRYHVHVLCVHTEAVLKFATEIAEEAPDNLTREDKEIFNALADYLDRACHHAERLKRRVR